MMVLVYVDDCILFGKKEQELDSMLTKLKDRFELTVEDVAADEGVDVFNYLGVELTLDNRTGNVTFLQTGLIDKVLKYCRMTDCNTKSTPAASTPLGTDANGKHRQEDWDYATAIGMLLYLSSNSRPDIQFAVHQCARFTHVPRASHEEAIKRICRYLKGTRNKGLTFNPSTEYTMDCYVDADFAGLWNVEHHDDPVCVKSRTGFVITLGGCPLHWVSKLQTEVALSTTEAEYIALSQAMRHLLPMRRILLEIGTKMQLGINAKTLVRSTVWEDNNGALKLANNESQCSLRTKHIAVKYHFFRSHVGKDIMVERINTDDQIADIFTKGLDSLKFAKLSALLMGWNSGDSLHRHLPG
jgi:hypothetical protein